METDKITLNDLNIFHAEECNSIFGNINFTRTLIGKEQLRNFIQTPLKSASEILNVQQTIHRIQRVIEKWPNTITNGTIMVVEKFLSTPIETIPESCSNSKAVIYKFLNSNDYSLIKYSVAHCIDLLKSMKKIVEILYDNNNADLLRLILSDIDLILKNKSLVNVSKIDDVKYLTKKEILNWGLIFHQKNRSDLKEIMGLFAQLDAWYSMAKAVEKHNLVFPKFISNELPAIKLKGLFHPLLKNPVKYDTQIIDGNHFLFLTGANMAGKSTYIKAMGITVFLAHIGMGVPAAKMELTFFDGLLSNINIMDDISKGESYFFNEVQRIKSTINKINDGKKWLVLIDELFKGTNVEDAMKCSSIVIEGLLKIPQTIFILSTHLYEISVSLQKQNNILFYYFETTANDEHFAFNYQLKEGVSNDRLGYLILKKEGIIEMLNKIHI
jgi:DNA mismatch repair ATPase MutS